MTVSNLSFMLDMTVVQAAGLYIGAWGVANFAGQALGNIASGLIRDVAFRLTGSEMVGYSTVFALEIVGLIAAIAAVPRHHRRDLPPPGGGTALRYPGRRD